MTQKLPPTGLPPMSLRECAELLEKVLIYQIGIDQRHGDSEGVALKSMTLARVRESIKAAKDEKHG